MMHLRGRSQQTRRNRLSSDIYVNITFLRRVTSTTTFTSNTIVEIARYKDGFTYIPSLTFCLNVNLPCCALIERTSKSLSENSAFNWCCVLA